MKLKAPDLRKQPPRSPRVKLGGFVLFPRILDKCRATLAGCNGEYNFNCPLDERFFAFAGVQAQAFKKQVATGKGDWEMWLWLQRHSTTKPGPAQIATWSAWQEQRAPDNLDGREHFSEIHKQCGPHREDVATWFDLLDLDDYAFFGGAP
jgi:Domain of unknown function (DUF5069)